MKRLNLKVLIIGMIVGILFMGGASYATSQLTTIEVHINPVAFFYNDEQLQPELDTFIVDGTTYVPVRWISEALDKKVEWDEKNRAVMISDKVKEEKQTSSKADNQKVKFFTDKGEYSSSDTIQLTIINEGYSSISFGMPYQIEQLKDKEWEELDLGLFFTMQLIMLEQGQSFEQLIDIDQLDLEEGTYRVVKNIFIDEEATELVAEFQVK